VNPFRIDQPSLEYFNYYTYWSSTRTAQTSCSSAWSN